jgi:uncharacterized protein (TIGR02598 family)
MRLCAFKSFAFSLVELTLALGVAAFCLVAVFGLMPVGVQTSRNATSQTSATNIMAAVVADLRATQITRDTSSQFGIQFGTDTTLYFDSAGQAFRTPDSESRYRLQMTWNGSVALPYADLTVTWPAPAMPANASGSAKMFAAFDRN